MSFFLTLNIIHQSHDRLHWFTEAFADEPEAIVGGQRAAPGEFPWQCSLTVNGQHICGCSILSETKILTAAHCLQGIVQPPYNNLRVLTGNININQGDSHAVQKAVIHPNYKPSAAFLWDNDIAVITVSHIFLLLQF